MSNAVFPGALIAAALVLQLLVDRSCTYGATDKLELAAITGIVLDGSALALVLRRFWMDSFGATGPAWWGATAALALIALALNREVWSEMLTARPCGPIEYEDGVRYRASHAVIGIGYGLMPLLVAAAATAIALCKASFRSTPRAIDR
jgi:hypothetical protein